MAPPVTELQRPLTLGETVFKWLDTTINVDNVCCIRLGPRYSVGLAYIAFASRLLLPALLGLAGNSLEVRREAHGPTLTFCLGASYAAGLHLPPNKLLQ